MRQRLADIFNLLYDFRQFITFAALLIIAVIFRVMSLLNGSEFVDLMKNVTVALFAIHGVGHLISFGKDFIGAKYAQGGDDDDAPTASPPPVQEHP